MKCPEHKVEWWVCLNWEHARPLETARPSCKTGGACKVKEARK